MHIILVYVTNYLENGYGFFWPLNQVYSSVKSSIYAMGFEPGASIGVLRKQKLRLTRGRSA